MNDGITPTTEDTKIMTLEKKHFLAVAGLVALTNGLSLLGFGNASAGALARTIECNSAIARHSEASVTLKHLAGTPPCEPERSFTGPFRYACAEQ